MTADLDLLRSHQVVAELLATGLVPQHLDYHPGPAPGHPTTVTVGVPSRHDWWLAWCRRLGVTAVTVTDQRDTSTACAEINYRCVRFRITTYLRGEQRARAHAYVQWHPNDRTGRPTTTGTTSVDRIASALAHRPAVAGTA